MGAMVVDYLGFALKFLTVEERKTEERWATAKSGLEVKVRELVACQIYTLNSEYRPMNWRRSYDGTGTEKRENAL